MNRGSEMHHHRWLLTFNDMMTLVLTFFVLILSMSSLDMNRVRQASNAAADAFGATLQTREAVSVVFEPILTSIADPDIERQRMHDALNGSKPQPGKTAELELIGAFNRLPGVSARMVDGRLSVILDDALMFEPGSAELAVNDPLTLEAIRGIFKSTDGDIRVEGHTDDRPIRSRYPSNWELSTARAVNVVKYLMDGGVAPERLSAAGYADCKPAVPNSDESKRALNRRVEILLLSHKIQPLSDQAGGETIPGP